MHSDWLLPSPQQQKTGRGVRGKSKFQNCGHRVQSDKRWISFLIKTRLNLTLGRESPAAGGLRRQLGSLRKRQAERHDQGLACGHLHRWHFHPGGRFGQRGGFGGTGRCGVRAVHGDGELERRGGSENGAITKSDHDDVDHLRVCTLAQCPLSAFKG